MATSCTVITKETISRLINDVKNIMKNPLSEHGIYYQHDEADMLKGYALIIGQEGTPYFGGFYFFEITYPHNYPFSPPKVEFCTNNGSVRFNPNLYTNGKVCISILNTWKGEQWTACQTISTILLSLSSLLCKDPLLNEPGINQYHPDLKKYSDIIEYSNIETAICSIISKNTRTYLSKFSIFDDVAINHFLKIYDALLLFVTNKCNLNGSGSYIINTGVYSMRICIDYNNLVNKLIACKTIALTNTSTNTNAIV